MTTTATHEFNADLKADQAGENSQERVIGRGSALLLLLPLLIVFALGFVIPLATIARFSFDVSDGQQAAWGLSEYSDVLSSGSDRSAILRTFMFAGITAAISAFLAYPIGIAITRGPRWARMPLIAVVLMPLLVSVVVKTFGWTVLLSATSFPQRWLNELHVPVQLLFSNTGVVIGLVHTFMPFMALSVVAALASVDRSTEEAALSLGSSPLRAFFTVTFPQTIAGLVAGSVLTFSVSMSALVTPQLLGGGRVSTVVTVIYRQVTSGQNFPRAAALGILLLVTTLMIMFAHGRLMGRLAND